MNIVKITAIGKSGKIYLDEATDLEMDKAKKKAYDFLYDEERGTINEDFGVFLIDSQGNEFNLQNFGEMPEFIDDEEEIANMDIEEE